MTDTPADTSAAYISPVGTDANDARLATRRRWLTRLGVAVLVGALLFGAWYYIIGRNYVSTDDAYVGADMAEVTPLTSAAVVAVHAADTDVVKAGDVLVELDGSDAKIAVAQAEADVVTAQRHFRQTVANGQALASQVNARGNDIAAAVAQVASARANADAARINLGRVQALAPSGAASGAELLSATKDKANADAALAAAGANLAQARATQGSASGQLAANNALTHGLSEDTDPGVQAAAARLASARLNLDRMVIRAPIDGVVTERRVQVGQRVAQGVAIMAIVPAQVFVDANFKERQLTRVRPGQPAEVIADVYGSSVKFHGTVAGVGGATGAATALIPAQNATGNWIKVVQRLPVRIKLDPRELRDHPLRVGLSAEVTVDVSGNLSGNAGGSGN